MSDLVGAKGELQIIVEIVRKDTGNKEIYTLIGAIDPKDLEQLQEKENGGNP